MSGAWTSAPKPTSTPKRASRYRPWADLLKRTFAVNVLACPAWRGRMKLVAMLTEPKSVVRYLAAFGENTDVPVRSPSRGPPDCKSKVLRQKAIGDVALRRGDRADSTTTDSKS